MRNFHEIMLDQLPNGHWNWLLREYEVKADHNSLSKEEVKARVDTGTCYDVTETTGTALTREEALAAAKTAEGGQ